MLEEITRIRGVGLFADAGPSPRLARVNFVFAENGRGKSTLASILRSCSDGAADLIIERSTLGGATQPDVSLHFQPPKGPLVELRFANGQWAALAPEFEVFDAEFVSRNVYAGVTINSDHRASLLEFALGEEAVGLRKIVDSASSALTAASAALTAHSGVLKARAGALSIDAFLKLDRIENVDTEIDRIQKRLAAAGSMAAILSKTLPRKVDLPKFDADAFFGLLSRSLPQVEAAAEGMVRSHIAKVKKPRFENWLAEGVGFVVDEGCPYCGSDIKDNDLIKAYQAHFNKAYDELRIASEKLEGQVDVRLGDGVVEGLRQSFETARAQVEVWRDHVDVPHLTFDDGLMRQRLADLRAFVLPFATAKARQPLEHSGSQEDMMRASSGWAGVVSVAESVNAEIAGAIATIEAYRASLGVEDAEKLKGQLAQLLLRKLRHSADVVLEVARYRELLDERDRASKAKEVARTKLDELMTKTLATYQEEINVLLDRFGSQVRIDGLKFDYRGAGGSPRSDYHLKVRGHDVRLSGGGSASFANALSEGDKRSLAFAFFIAKLQKDPGLASRIVVIDDPMCSLDRGRRSSTIRLLKVLALSCRQLIVLAHDPFFLQALDDELNQNAVAKIVGSPQYLKLIRVADNLSTFDALDLSSECASRYEVDLAQIGRFVNGDAGTNKGDVAKSLRVVLETSLHRQFPSLIPRGKMLGDVIGLIEKADAKSQLSSLKHRVAELRAINDYAKAFHHADGEPPPDLTSLDEGELEAYARRVLAIVYRG